MDLKEAIYQNSIELLNEVNLITTKYKDLEKLKTENFNLFAAIVSGKNEKTHRELYHSNFLGYILNPKGSHNLDDFFLKMFLSEIKENYPLVNNLPETTELVIQRERPTNQNRSIDITLESGKNWIIFIENKIWSTELESQVKDYYEFSKRFKNRLGIYLTLTGERPPSITNEVNSEIPQYELINMSYEFVINWLEKCLIDDVIKGNANALFSLNQYLNVIKKLTNKTKNSKMSIEIANYITEKGLIEEALEIERSINMAKEKIMFDYFNSLADEQKWKIQLSHENRVIRFENQNWKHFIWISFTNDFQVAFIKITNCKGELETIDNKVKFLTEIDEFRYCEDDMIIAKFQYWDRLNWRNVGDKKTSEDTKNFVGELVEILN